MRNLIAATIVVAWCKGRRVKRWLACGAIAAGIDDAARRKGMAGSFFYDACKCAREVGEVKGRVDWVIKRLRCDY